MIKAEFPHHNQRWDRYKAFHIISGPFAQFSTGEVMVNRKPAPEQRKYYPEFGVQIVGTTDGSCPTLYLDKECQNPIPTAWVSQGGMQELAIDREQCVAVKVAKDLCRQYNNKAPELQFLGNHVRQASVLWTGPNRLPIPLAQIEVSEPDKDVKKGLTRKLKHIRDALRAAARIQGVEPPMWDNQRWNADPKWVDMPVEDIVAELCANKIILRWAAYNGFSYPRKVTKHDFLYIHPSESVVTP